MADELKALLDFWFEPANEANWFGGGADFDAALAQRFGDLYDCAAEAGAASAAETPDGRLAAILLFDQIPRNTRRGAAAAFATDGLALALTKRGLACGDDLFFKAERPEPWRLFFYMPLMHSEDLGDQRRCVELLATHGPEQGTAFARRHHDIVARFGRFPHRNAALGRVSTPDERRFLEQPGTAF